jgi:dTDP-4-dehydrorhamnose reductase
MRLLVTGARGLLGHDLLRTLAVFPERFDVFAVDHQALDVTDRDAVRKMVDDGRPDWIVHLAAYTNVDGAESDVETAFRVNRDGTRSVVAAAEPVGARVLYLSTDYVFDGHRTDGVPYREEDVTAPEGAYARSKRAGEEAILDARGLHVIVRTSWLYGAGGKNFVDTVLTRALAGQPLAVVTDQIGSPTYAADLSAALVRVLEAKVPGGVLHAANRGFCSWYDLARETLTLAGLNPDAVAPTTTDALGRPAPRPRWSALDTSRLTRLTGYEPPQWQDAVRRYVAERPERGRSEHTSKGETTHAGA